MSDNGEGGERLEDGWGPETPPTDHIVRAQNLNIVDRLERTAEMMGGAVISDDTMCVARFETPSLWSNGGYLLRPIAADESTAVGDRLDEFFGEGEAAFFSPVPTPDFTDRGWLRMGHPPFMYRPPGGGVPPVPDGLTVERIEEPPGVPEWEDALARGFPLSAPGQWKPATMYDERAFGLMEFFVGRVGGEVVCTAAAHVAAGVCQVEWVSTLEEHRGKGYGEAVTWAATLAEPDLPAVLISSDLGRPVYERMGYVSVVRFSGWIKPGPPAEG